MTLKMTAAVQTFIFCLSQSRSRPRNNSSSVKGATSTSSSKASGSCVQLSKLTVDGTCANLMPAQKKIQRTMYMKAMIAIAVSALDSSGFRPTGANRARKPGQPRFSEVQ